MPLVIKSAAKKKNIGGENYENEEFFIFCRGNWCNVQREIQMSNL